MVSEEQAPIVLVIDDELAFRKIASDFLGWHGIQAVAAAGGREGVALARERNPDLVLLDLRLYSDFSGEDALGQLKGDARTRDIPVIAVSGFERTVEAEARLIRAGAHALLDKRSAFDPEQQDPELVRTIKALILARRGPPRVNATLEPVQSRPHLPPLATRRAVTRITLPERDAVVSTVLVLENGHAFFDALKNELRSPSSCRVLLAETAEQGLNLIPAELPDIVVADFHSPGFLSPDFCGRLRSALKSAPWRPFVVAAVPSEGREQQELTANLGACECLVGMSDPAAHAEKIQNLLGWRWRDELREIALSCPASPAEPSERRVPLTHKEGALMRLLLTASIDFVHKSALHKKLYGKWPRPDNTRVKTHIAYIRRKLGPHEELIQSRRDGGYRFNFELARTLHFLG